MDMTITGLPPIPVEYIIGVAQTKDTDAKRRPYVSLIEDWGKERDMEQEASDVLKQLRDNQEIDVKKMPKEFSPKYREKEVAKQLIAIINDINDIISSKSELWTWAHVMRVMLDEGILIKVSIWLQHLSVMMVAQYWQKVTVGTPSLHSLWVGGFLMRNLWRRHVLG